MKILFTRLITPLFITLCFCLQSHGQNWQALRAGTSGQVSHSDATYTSLVLASDGNSYLACVDGANGDRVGHRDYKGQLWITENRFIAAGATNVKFIPIEGGTHQTSIEPIMVNALS